VCVVSLAALWVRFSVSSGGLFLSQYDTHEADTLEHTWYDFSTAGQNSYVPIPLGFIVSFNIFLPFMSQLLYGRLWTIYHHYLGNRDSYIM